jgi:hypothetical protein
LANARELPERPAAEGAGIAHRAVQAHVVAFASIDADARAVERRV